MILSSDIPYKLVQRGREDQELRTRIRVLEARREEDAKHIRELEARRVEAENFVAIRPKLQGNRCLSRSRKYFADRLQQN